MGAMTPNFTRLHNRSCTHLVIYITGVPFMLSLSTTGVTGNPDGSRLSLQ